MIIKSTIKYADEEKTIGLFGRCTELAHFAVYKT